MHRRALVTGAVSLLAVPPVSHGQSAAKSHRIGWLAPARVPFDLAIFREGLRTHGWIEGENVSIIARYSGGANEALSTLAAELVASRVDLIVTTTTSATMEVQAKTTSIPIVFAIGSDPIARGFAMSFGRPGKNLTGVATLTNLQLNVKMLELLRVAMPPLARVGMFRQPTPVHEEAIRAVADGARVLSLQMVSVPVQSGEEIDQAGALLSRERVEAFLVLSSPFFHAHKSRFIALAARMRLPAIYEHREFVEAGGLMSYGMDLRELFRRMAAKADQILRGAKPGDLPIEQPTKVELVINLKTAKALGLTIPQTLLQRADQIIQ